jgi:hypothetical protein
MRALNLTRLPRASKISYFSDRLLAPCAAALAEAAPEICTDATGFDRLAFHRQFNADVLVFLRKHLTGAK